MLRHMSHTGVSAGNICYNLYLYNTNSVCVCVCLSSIGGQTAGPIMTKFGTNMRIDLGMVPTKYWPHEWPGSVGSLGPISESGLSCQLLLRAVVWQMTSQLIRRRNDVVFAAFNQPVSMRPMNVQKILGREGRRQGRIGERGERDERGRGRDTGREGLERSRVSS